MKIEITIDGKTYKSKSIDDVTQSEAAESMYELFENFNKLKIDLEDGGILLIGSDAVQKAQVVIYS